MKETLKRKLSSRKFWVALTGFVTAILVALGAEEMTVTQVVAVMGALGTLAVYILAEGMSDAKNSSSKMRADEENKKNIGEERKEE